MKSGSVNRTVVPTHSNIDIRHVIVPIMLREQIHTSL